MAKATPKAAEVAAPLREPNERDKAAIARATERVLARRKRASVKVHGESKDMRLGATHFDDDGFQKQLLDTFGTASSDFLNTALAQMLNAIHDNGDTTPGATQINAALAIVGGIEPENEVEALLATQMAATHGLAMSMLGRARRTDYLDRINIYGGLAVKLTRTFALQAEALAKLRRGGGQTVRVEHVHVHAGGQAIVGNVTPGGGASTEIEDQPHAKQIAALTYADAPFDPLRSAHPQRERVPVASNG